MAGNIWQALPLGYDAATCARKPVRSANSSKQGQQPHRLFGQLPSYCTPAPFQVNNLTLPMAE